MFTGTDLIVIPGVAGGFTLPLLVSKAVLQALLNLDTLRLFELILLLEGVVGHNLVIDTVIELSIVIELILPIDLSTLLAEAKNLLLDFHELHNLASSFILAHWALLTHR